MSKYAEHILEVHRRHISLLRIKKFDFKYFSNQINNILICFQQLPLHALNLFPSSKFLNDSKLLRQHATGL